MRQILFVAMAVSLAGAANADNFSYACKLKGQSEVLRIDDAHNELSWHGRTYRTKQLNQDSCPRYGLHATRPGEQFDFCTATKGYADFVDHGANVVCHQIAVPEDYLGRWALVPEKNGSCNPDEGPAEVTGDNIQTYHEDYCRILDAKEIKQPGDPRVEITCMSGGEGGSETKAHETWRLRNLLGRQVFIEQGAGGMLFWQRCPQDIAIRRQGLWPSNFSGENALSAPIKSRSRDP